MDASIPDLFRLLAVPVLTWAAISDLRTRRVPNRTWVPLLALGGLLLAGDLLARHGEPGFALFLVRVALSLLLVGGLSMGFWFLGGFGGADAKAFATLAVLFPTYPTYVLGDRVLPVVTTDIGVFSLSILTNAVLIGAGYPLALWVANARFGRIGPLAFVARPVPVAGIERRHGTLLDTDGSFTRSGLDLDALRMYLRWRRLDLDRLRGRPALADPETLPETPGEPTDGAVTVESPTENSEATTSLDPPAPAAEDRWAADVFLEAVGSAYGTDPEELRSALDRLVRADRVWVSPGIPFIVPTVIGLVVALTIGDLLFFLLGVAGFV